MGWGTAHEQLEFVAAGDGVVHVAYPTALRTLCCVCRDDMLSVADSAAADCDGCADMMGQFARMFPGSMPAIPKAA